MAVSGGGFRRGLRWAFRTGASRATARTDTSSTRSAGRTGGMDLRAAWPAPRWWCSATYCFSSSSAWPTIARFRRPTVVGPLEEALMPERTPAGLFEGTLLRQGDPGYDGARDAGRGGPFGSRWSLHRRSGSGSRCRPGTALVRRRRLGPPAGTQAQVGTGQRLPLLPRARATGRPARASLIRIRHRSRGPSRRAPGLMCGGGWLRSLAPGRWESVLMTSHSVLSSTGSPLPWWRPRRTRSWPSARAPCLRRPTRLRPDRW